MNPRWFLNSGHPRRRLGVGRYLAMSVLAGCFLVPAPRMQADESPFRFAPIGERSLGLWDGDHPVLVYNFGVISKPGVAEKFARSSYLHPVYGLDGEVITDDFPVDHLHHRGLFWAWPHVVTDGKEYDLWALNGMRHQFVRWTAMVTTPYRAELGVENGWFVGDSNVMTERICLVVHHADEQGRAIDLHGVWTPTDQPVTLVGAESKSYGGLTFRFAPGTDTAITIPSGKTVGDLYMTHQPWTDLTRVWPGRKNPSGAAVFVHPSHPDFPPTWLTRHYGALCMGWPGVVSKTITSDHPFEGRYRVWVHRGALDSPMIERNYKAYISEPLENP